MGLPIFGLLAELKLGPGESEIILTSILKPSLWIRFVDDILII